MRVTTKGQVTIPQAIRRKLNIRPGSEVEFVLKEDGVVYLVKKDEPEQKNRFQQLRGSADIQLTTDEIMALTRGDDG